MPDLTEAREWLILNNGCFFGVGHQFSLNHVIAQSGHATHPDATLA